MNLAVYFISYTISENRGTHAIAVVDVVVVQVAIRIDVEPVRVVVVEVVRRQEPEPKPHNEQIGQFIRHNPRLNYKFNPNLLNFFENALPYPKAFLQL